METNTPDDITDYWAEIQEGLTDALVQYQRTKSELFELMKENAYFNTMIRNVFANGWARENMAAAKKLGGQ